MKALTAFASGLGLAALVALGFEKARARRLTSRVARPEIDLNDASAGQLLGIGLEQAVVDRIIEGRPYRNKLELVSRIMLPSNVYSSVKDRITVSRTQDAIKVAS